MSEQIISGVLEANSECDYTLTGDSVWITVGNISVNVRRTDEGVVVDLYPLHQEMDESVASTYAFFSECEPEEVEAKKKFEEKA